MDYHNCKDLPVWAQILVNSAPEAKHKRVADSDLPDERQRAEQEEAA